MFYSPSEQWLLWGQKGKWQGNEKSKPRVAKHPAWDQLLEEKTSTFLWTQASLRSKSTSHLSQQHQQNSSPDFGQLKQMIISSQEMNHSPGTGSQWCSTARGSKYSRPVGRKVWFQFSVAPCCGSVKCCKLGEDHCLTYTSGSNPRRSKWRAKGCCSLFKKQFKTSSEPEHPYFISLPGARPDLQLNTWGTVNISKWMLAIQVLATQFVLGAYLMKAGI